MDRAMELPITGETVVTIGTFDGIHIGHRKVLEQVVREAGKRGMTSLVITFDPHPLKVLRPSEAPGLLSTIDEKLKLLTQFDIDLVEIIPFTTEFSRLTPRRFVEEILFEEYSMRALVVGYDHGFGRGRGGSPAMLRSLSREMGFSLVVVGPVEVDGEKVSSSRIRKYIGNADFHYVGRALGRRYSLSASVVPGEGRGRTIGFPTANLKVLGGGKLLPPDGVYVVEVLLDGRPYPGMMHQGERPTFPGVPASIEVHLIGFDGEIIGRDVEVEYIDWLRDIRHFDGPVELRDQLVRDRSEAMKKYIEI
jgi:riboflavin kinase/FMN adenylyltransferase